MLDITIRAAELEDCEGLAALYACPKVLAGTLRMPYTSVRSTRQRLESMPGTTHSLVAITAGSNQLVGNLGLVCNSSPPRQHAASIGVAVRDDCHRQGVGSQLLIEALKMADNWLHLSRIELMVYIDNEPAVALYKKFGFELEGTLKKYAFRAGKYVDAYTMARIV